MSWSDNRTKNSGIPLAVRKENLRQVNMVLQKLAPDDDLHDDLLMPEVKRALNHWTGVSRLPPDEAVKLQDNRRVIYVLQRLQLFQSVCKQSGIHQVPIELFLNRKKYLPNDLAVRFFGQDIVDLESTTVKQSTVTNNQRATSSSASVEKVNKTNVNDLDGDQKKKDSMEPSGATEEEIQAAKQSTDNLRASAEVDYCKNREKIEKMMEETPPPESNTLLLNLLTVLVSFLAVFLYLYTSRENVSKIDV